MYRVGFGDCFLLTLTGDRPYHVLVDCGVHSQGNLGTLPAAVQDIAKETGGRLDLVIATHAHQDHISGFGSCAEAFARFSVGEVWLPWTEDLGNKTAARLRQKHDVVTRQLAQHFAAAGAAPHAMAALQNLMGNEVALKILRGGLNSGKVRYLKAGCTLENAAGIPGLAARLLGPPDNEAFLARMDPPAGDRFLRAAAGGGAEPANPIQPFPGFWTVPPGHYPDGILSDADMAALQEMSSDPEALAFTLTSAMNNTSLVTLFSFAGRNLLFPGDAQYGNWEAWINDPAAQEILGSIDFYKVSHHGSVNATPKRVVAGMTQGRFAAMVSTQDKPWPSIPWGKLITALMERSCGVARSDAIPVPGTAGVSAQAPPVFVQGPIWYDYTIRR